jgi:ribonuclease R
VGVHCSETERRADDATRDVEAWLKSYFMQDRVGEEFDGTVSGVTSFGLFVTLDELFVDGLVHISDLGQDYFKFDQQRHVLKGERSGAKYQLGGRVRVKVVRVNLEQAKIDFVLVDAPKAWEVPAPEEKGRSPRLRDYDRKMAKLERQNATPSQREPKPKSKKTKKAR